MQRGSKRTQPCKVDESSNLTVFPILDEATVKLIGSFLEDDVFALAGLARSCRHMHRHLGQHKLLVHYRRGVPWCQLHDSAWRDERLLRWAKRRGVYLPYTLAREAAAAGDMAAVKMLGRLLLLLNGMKRR